jgi:hypothetical protein
LIFHRVSERVQHVAGIAEMANPFAELRQPRIKEEERYAALISTLQRRKGPVFAHVHMTNTHGPTFRFTHQRFSAGQDKKGPKAKWNEDLYDDAIASFDQYIGDFFAFLEQSGELDRTVVVLYSDHGFQWQPNRRVPLLFWFPRRQHAGVVSRNVQNLDIVPTVLDYLQVAIPPWVEGRSLLSAVAASPPEPIFFAGTSADLTVRASGKTMLDERRAKAPFYQLAYLGFVMCNQWYRLDLLNPGLEYGTVAGHTAPCPPETLPHPDEARNIVLTHLAGKGYDVTAFPRSVPVSGPR